VTTPGHRQTLPEEFANAASHALGCLLVVAAVPAFAMAGGGERAPAHWAGLSVFVGTMLLMYGVSSLYHALPMGRAKAVLRRLDHATIFLFIAGSYTPFALGQPRGGDGAQLLWTIWGIALIGVTLKLCDRLLHRPGLSTTLYLAFGWMVAAAALPVLETLPPDGLLLMVAGGLAYTAGCVFFLLGDRLRYSHLVWHLFVIAGSACHFGAVLRAAS
jgi:hemolysin III